MFSFPTFFFSFQFCSLTLLCLQNTHTFLSFFCHLKTLLFAFPRLFASLSFSFDLTAILFFCFLPYFISARTIDLQALTKLLHKRRHRSGATHKRVFCFWNTCRHYCVICLLCCACICHTLLLCALVMHLCDSRIFVLLLEVRHITIN